MIDLTGSGEEGSIKIDVKPVAMLFMAAVFYFIPFNLIAAYFVAIAVHELGHILALYLLKKSIYAAHIELRGIVIEHEGGLNNGESFVCSAMGPLLGVLYAYAASYVAYITKYAFFQLSAGLSFALSLFNLLPAIPLDGSFMLRSVFLLFFEDAAVDKYVLFTSIAVITTMFLSGLYFTICGTGYFVLIAAFSLLVFLMFEEGIVKRGKLR